VIEASEVRVPTMPASSTTSTLRAEKPPWGVVESSEEAAMVWEDSAVVSTGCGSPNRLRDPGTRRCQASRAASSANVCRFRGSDHDVAIAAGGELYDEVDLLG
jgi:hypothetical protein